MENFSLCFVPLFVAVDAFGVLPIFIAFIEGVDRKQVRKLIIQSTLTAMGVALVFLFVGKAVLSLLGIKVEDFLVAGGIVLFLISINDLLSFHKQQVHIDPVSLGPVPIGVPLIVGPAVLTTIMLLVHEYGIIPTGLATIANVLIAGILFSLSKVLVRLLGDSGTKIVSKVANLFLAAIAVMMVRKGIFAFIAN